MNNILKVLTIFILSMNTFIYFQESHVCKSVDEWFFDWRITSTDHGNPLHISGSMTLAPISLFEKIADSIEKIDSAFVRTFLEETLRHNHHPEDVVNKVAAYIRNLRGGALYEVGHKAISNRYALIRQAVSEALNQADFGAGFLEPLIHNALMDSDKDARIAALFALGTIKHNKAMDTLVSIYISLATKSGSLSAFEVLIKASVRESLKKGGAYACVYLLSLLEENRLKEEQKDVVFPILSEMSVGDESVTFWECLLTKSQRERREIALDAFVHMVIIDKNVKALEVLTSYFMGADSYNQDQILKRISAMLQGIQRLLYAPSFDQASFLVKKIDSSGEQEVAALNRLIQAMGASTMGRIILTRERMKVSDKRTTLHFPEEAGEAYYVQKKPGPVVFPQPVPAVFPRDEDSTTRSRYEQQLYHSGTSTVKISRQAILAEQGKVSFAPAERVDSHVKKTRISVAAVRASLQAL